MILVDTNILTRLVQKDAPSHAAARGAVLALRRQRRLVVFPQNLYEFWVVATRPDSANGIGLTTASARQWCGYFERSFELHTDPPELYATWKRLVTDADVKGRPAHDARLAAAMHLHGIGDILTFNPGDFKRFGLNVLDPYAVAGMAKPT